jgi:predicted Zn-ribbon and HTH transcriptional regulator
MDKVVFGEYTVQDVLIVAGVIVGVLILAALLKRIFSRSKYDVYAQPVSCEQCGWQGKVSRYAGRCPRCNNPLGDRRVSQS